MARMTELQSLLRGVARPQAGRLLVLSALAALSNVGVLALLNSAAGDPSMANGTRDLFLVVIMVAIYRTAQRAVMVGAAQEVEGVLHRTRLALLDRVLQIDLQALDTVGAGEILAVLTRHAQTISDSLTVLLVGVQSALLIVVVLLYIATLSLPAFLLTAAFIGVTLAVQHASGRMAQANLRSATAGEARLFGILRDCLEGFKEVKMHRPRAQALLDALSGQAQAVAGAMGRLRRRTAEQFVFGQASLLIMLGAMVLLEPLVAPFTSSVLIRVTTSVLFVIGSVGLLVQSVPVLAQAENAAASIAGLRRQLDSLGPAATPAGAPAATPNAAFQELVLEGLQFRYPTQGDEPGFAIGPLDVTVQRGEMVFVTGGNGSGKSTLLRLLTGLYPPGAGSIRLDQTAITADNQQAYRNMIAAVFGDFHLFRRLYVMPAGGAAQVQASLAAMDLAGKTALDEANRFTSLDLSAGQRRRLALALALLQDRPILVLDEVAADFDPGFRRHFYQDMLPALKQAGKTIIAASHDERYFHVADRILRLEDGRIHRINGAFA